MSPRARATRGGGTAAGLRALAARWGWWVGGVLVLVYAVQGGEYGTTDLLRQRARVTALRAEIVRLRHDVDSLRVVAHGLASDPAVQERVAREEFGMVGSQKELLYRFARRDTLGDTSAR